MLIHCCVTLKMAALTLPVILFIITTRLNVGQDWIMERVKDLKKINRQREGEREGEIEGERKGEYQLNKVSNKTSIKLKIVIKNFN